MLKNVINVDKEYVFQDMPNILSDIMVTEFPTQRKDEQSILDDYEETRILKSYTDAKENPCVQHTEKAI